MKKILLFCVSLTSCLALQALTDGPWSFTVANGEAALTGYSGMGPEDFVLPSSVESDGTNYTVTAVGSSAFIRSFHHFWLGERNGIHQLCQYK